MSDEFASAIYSGHVRHRRFSPKSHAFNYRVFMMYLDTREIDKVFALSPFWSLSKWAPVRFKRRDFHLGNHEDHSQPLVSVDEAVRATVLARTGISLTGPIRMLVNLRYWGFNMNPLSTYYCFDDSGEHVQAILAEVHNTPWNERHSYVLTGEDFSKKQKTVFSKQFHVSPFNPVAMDYHWFSTAPQQTLAIHLENWQNDKKIMDATMALEREPITASSLNKILIRFPLMTVKVIAAIYWQAFKLWRKDVPLFDHPTLQHNISVGEEKRL